jgi:hypothetical protein
VALEMTAEARPLPPGLRAQPRHLLAPERAQAVMVRAVAWPSKTRPHSFQPAIETWQFDLTHNAEKKCETERGMRFGVQL